MLHDIERSASFLVDISKLNCLDDLKSNNGETISHQDQALRQIFADENAELPFEENTRWITMKMDG